MFLVTAAYDISEQNHKYDANLMIKIEHLVNFVRFLHIHQNGVTIDLK